MFCCINWNAFGAIGTWIAAIAAAVAGYFAYRAFQQSKASYDQSQKDADLNQRVQRATLISRLNERLDKLSTSMEEWDEMVKLAAINLESDPRTKIYLNRLLCFVEEAFDFYQDGLISKNDWLSYFSVLEQYYGKGEFYSFWDASNPTLNEFGDEFRETVSKRFNEVLHPATIRHM